MNFGKNPQHDFPKMRGGAGGGQRPFGTFPKIHPFLKGQASLREGGEYEEWGPTDNQSGTGRLL